MSCANCVIRSTLWPVNNHCLLIMNCCCLETTKANHCQGYQHFCFTVQLMTVDNCADYTVNAALLSCVNVCCSTLLSSELVGPACVQVVYDWLENFEPSSTLTRLTNFTTLTNILGGNTSEPSLISSQNPLTLIYRHQITNHCQLP